MPRFTLTNDVTHLRKSNVTLPLEARNTPQISYVRRPCLTASSKHFFSNTINTIYIHIHKIHILIIYITTTGTCTLIVVVYFKVFSR